MEAKVTTFSQLVEDAYYQASVKLLRAGNNYVDYGVVRELEILAAMRIRIIAEQIDAFIPQYTAKTLSDLTKELRMHVSQKRQLAQLRAEAAQLAVLELNPQINKLVLQYGTHDLENQTRTGAGNYHSTQGRSFGENSPGSSDQKGAGENQADGRHPSSGEGADGGGRL